MPRFHHSSNSSRCIIHLRLLISLYNIISLCSMLHNSRLHSSIPPSMLRSSMFRQTTLSINYHLRLVRAGRETSPINHARVLETPDRARLAYRPKKTRSSIYSGSGRRKIRRGLVRSSSTAILRRLLSSKTRQLRIFKN